MRKIIAELIIDFPGEEKIPLEELEEMMNEAMKTPHQFDEEGEDKSFIKLIGIIGKKKKKKWKTRKNQSPKAI